MHYFFHDTIIDPYYIMRIDTYLLNTPFWLIRKVQVGGSLHIMEISTETAQYIIVNEGGDENINERVMAL